MAERGEFRAIHVALADDPGFLALDTLERLMLVMLKLTLGQAGIAVVRAIEPELQHLTGAPSKGVRRAFQTLEKHDWVRTDGHVVWLRNGLKYEPHINLANENNRKGIEKYLQSLPKCNLVNDFARYYGLAEPFPDVSPSEGASPPPSKGVPHPPRSRDDGKGMTDDGKGITDVDGRSAGADPTASAFTEIWKLFPKREGSNPKPEALAAFKARLKEGVPAADMLAGARRYAAFIAETGQAGTRYVLRVASFLGPTKRGWEETWESGPETNGGGKRTPQAYRYDNPTTEFKGFNR